LSKGPTNPCNVENLLGVFIVKKHMLIFVGREKWRLEAYLSTEIATNSLFFKKPYEMHPTALKTKNTTHTACKI